MSTNFKYRRFANLAEMTAFAVYLAAAHSESKAFAEGGIYSDNNNLSHRAQVSIVCGDVVHVLRWNAFCEQPDIEFIGKRSRREARESSDWFTNHIQEAINTAAKSETVKQAAAAMGVPVIKFEKTESKPNDFSGLPKVNPARAALSRAVNRAIENGAPVIGEIPYWERPCAAAGLNSFRYRGPYGWIMIGAADAFGALKEAARSTESLIDPAKLERWNGTAYEAA